MMEMNYIKTLADETNLKVIEELLTGTDLKGFEASQYVCADPIDAGTVLSKIVYPAYALNPDVKEKTENALYEMLQGTDYSVFVVTLYVMSELFKEKYEIAPFKMALGKILEQLKIELHERQESIQNGLEYPNGCIRTKAWEELCRFKTVCEKEYDIILF